MRPLLPSRPVIQIGLVVASSFTAYTMIITVAPLYGLQLNVPIAAIGMLTASLSLFPLLLAVRTGTLADQFGSKRLMIVGSVILGLAPIGVVLSPGLVTLFIAQLAVGIGNLLVVVASQAQTVAQASGIDLEYQLGWYTTFVSAGQVIGPLIAGMVSDHYGFSAALASSVAVSLGALGFSLWLSNDRPLGGSGRASLTQEFRDAKNLLALDGVQFAFIVSFIVAFAQGVFIAFFPVILEAAGFTAGVIGILLSGRAAVSMVIRPVLGHVSRYLGGKRPALVIMLLFIGVSFVGIGLNQSITAAIIVCVLMGVWWGLAPPLSIVAMVDGVNRTQRGFALGLRFMASRLAQFVGPIAFGVTAQATTLHTANFLAGAVVLVYYVKCAIGFKYRTSSAQGIDACEKSPRR